MKLFIVPTYYCNLNCTACYSKRFYNRFNEYLTWEKFINIYEIFKNQVKSISFIGGEATYWKFINEAITFLNNHNIQVTLFSNATHVIEAHPNVIVVNISSIMQNPNEEQIIKNIAEYKRNHVKIVMRFNIDKSFSTYYKKSIRLANNFADSVSISILYPFDLTDKHIIGDQIYLLSDSLIRSGIGVKIARSTPICLFSNSQYEMLRNKCHLKSQCPLPTNSIVINPDGKTVQPCVELPIYKDLSSLIGSSPRLLFADEINELKSKEILSCSNCINNITCSGGCISYKSDSKFIM